MSPRTPLTHKRIFPVSSQDLERAGIVSTEVRRDLLALGASPDVARRAGIVCFEGEMNIVLYSEGGRIILIVREDRVELLFSDRGPGIADIDLVSQPGYSTAPDWARELGFGAGLGITNMEENSDLFKIRSRVGQGTVVRATILLGVPFF
ncbi:TPA: anti-sigma regulatory factor [Candidatus Acetothermia bacterium]|nr:anti-sigma regulatory factor [Candidatus Acetothermia bacterium]HAZ30551.1 anti-sigma regulatory factor [Candidatus Acetothermia bacterium]